MTSDVRWFITLLPKWALKFKWLLHNWEELTRHTLFLKQYFPFFPPVKHRFFFFLERDFQMKFHCSETESESKTWKTEIFQRIYIYMDAFLTVFLAAMVNQSPSQAEVPKLPTNPQTHVKCLGLGSQCLAASFISKDPHRCPEFSCVTNHLLESFRIQMLTLKFS